MGLLALLLLGQSMRSPAVEAEPTGIVTINPLLCLVLTISEDWNEDTVVDGADRMVALSSCYHLGFEVYMRNLVRVLGGDDDNPEPEDLAAIDSDGGQMHDTDGALAFVVFVSNDYPVTFYADEGVFEASGTSVASCGSGAGYDFMDEDCNNNGVKGDGVVTAVLTPTGGDRGEAAVVAQQAGMEVEEGYKIVGEPYEIELTAVEPSIERGATSCLYPKTEVEWDAAVADAHKTGLVGRVLDSDGAAITGALVAWESADESQAVVAMPVDATPVGVTTDMGADRFEAVNVLCGAANTGAVTVEAAITDGSEELGIGLDPSAREDNDTVEVQVVGAPVGGVVEFPQLEPKAVSGGRGSSGPNAIALSGAIAGGALLLAAGGWYARRRWRAG